MTGIFYFSATGNSLYIAERIRKKTGGEIRFIPTFSGSFADYDKVVVVSPLFGFGLPRPTYEFLKSMNVTVPVYVVLNYGGAPGPAERLAQDICLGAGLDLRGVWAMRMPVNFTIVVPVPKKYQQGAMKKAPAAADKIADKIARGETRRIKSKNDGSLGNYVKNLESLRAFSDKFSSSDACTGCKRCQEVCPTGNIAVVAGAPVWGDKCCACLACLHRCPQNAILCKGKKKGQYLNPEIDESKIGSDE